jgi:hypothetical protein
MADPKTAWSTDVFARTEDRIDPIKDFALQAAVKIKMKA